MTSISGSLSPADRIQQALQNAVSAGTVKASDQSALSGAISDIDTALQGGASTTAALKPGDMKSKVDGLVDDEVSSGKITSDQADELKKVFAQAMGGHHHGHHIKAPDDSSAATDITSTDTSAIDGSSTTSSSTTDTSSTSTTASSSDSLTQSIQTLMSFLQKLESATSSSTNYNSTGTSAGSLAKSLLVNLNA